MVKLNWKINRFAELQAQLPSIAGRIVDVHTDTAISLMKVIVPVRTGFLRDSIHKEEVRSGLVATRGVQVDAPYWVFIEFGTVKMSARPFITPSMETIRTRFIPDSAIMIRQGLI